jgi:peptidoglycan/LPS O-acetylase OafA/YrhL
LDAALQGGAMQRRIPELDGLRAIAVTMVVLWHYVGIPAGNDSWLFLFFRLGRSGVDLFFVLSGFLITSILIESRGRSDYYASFYLRRALRILPLYAVMLLIYYAARWHGGGPDELFGGSFPDWTYVLFLQNVVSGFSGNYGPMWLAATWSLAVEEQFYLLFPLVVAFVPFSQLPRVLVLTILAAGLVRVVAAKIGGHAAAYVLMPCRADTLAIGALIAWAMKDDQARQWLLTNAHKVRRCCGAMIALTCLLWLIPTAGYYSHMANWGYSLLALLYGTILLAVLVSVGRPRLHILRTRTAAGIAEISYALYLVHAPALAGVFAFAHLPRTLNNGTAILLVVAALLLSVALSVLSLFLIERPARRLGGAGFTPRGAPVGHPSSVASRQSSVSPH